jgi:hypothetical protein
LPDDIALALHRELGAGRGSVLIPTLQFLSGVGVPGDATFIHEPLHLVCDLISVTLVDIL